MKTEVKLKKSKDASETYKVTFDGLTRGELLALRNALKYYGSPVGSDVHTYLNNALIIAANSNESFRKLIES